MRIIHVLRKPLSEGTVAANTMKHGTGGINIDASRIGTEQVPINRLEVWSGFGQKERPAYVATTSKGRWPANVILQHLDGCRCDGVKRVKGIGGGASSGDNAFGQDSGWNAHQNRPTNITRPMDKDGKETVANWICEPGCPVAALDEQSGLQKSGTAINRNRNPVKRATGIYGQYHKMSGVDQGHNDTGGASRFYKQVGGKTDE